MCQVYAMGIYKYPSRSENSVMPFVFTCPPPRTVMNRFDRIFVFGNFERIKLAEAELNVPFITVDTQQKRLGKWRYHNMSYLSFFAISDVVVLIFNVYASSYRGIST